MHKEEILKQACHFVSIGWPLDQDQVLRLYQQVEVAKNNIAPDEYKIGDETMAKVFKPNELTNISDLQAVFDAVEVALLQTNGVQGLERAAQFIDKRASDYIQEHGVTDPETGGVEFPGWGDEYVSELENLAESIRALSAPSPRAQALEEGIVKHANKTVTLGGQNYKAILLEDALSVVRALSSQPVAGRCKTVDELAAYLCDEFDFDLTPVRGASWPEHENDEGKRDGGYVRLQPSDVQAYARENAKRILAFLGLPASPGASDQSDAEAIAENYLQEIADGAWGDDGRTRGVARDRLKTMKGASE